MDTVIEYAYHDQLEPHRQAFTKWLHTFTPLQFYSGLFLIVGAVYALKIWTLFKTQQMFEENPPQSTLGMYSIASRPCVFTIHLRYDGLIAGVRLHQI